MNNILQKILELVQSLFGGSSSPAETAPPAHTHDCSVYNVEVPATADLDSLPFYQPSADSESSLSAQSINISCDIQIRPSLGRVNIRIGPRLSFDVMAKTIGGTVFELQGASEADPDGYRWYMVKTPVGAGWIRGDMLVIGEDCLAFTFIDEDDLTPPEPTTPSPTKRFPLPADVPITQGYYSTHRAYDLQTEYGTPLLANAPGLVIRRVDCTECEDSAQPNRYPCPSWMFRSEGWGFGYGNFLILRHNYQSLPPSMRDHMDKHDLGGGFVYILYAHLSENRVALGEFVETGQTIGLTGNHGCSSSPHLHFEVRMGRDEVVDGHWQEQTPVNPNLLFET